MNLPPKVRTYIYGVAVALIPILIIIGVITADQAGVWLNLAAAIIGIVPAGVATAHRPTKKTPL